MKINPVIILTVVATCIYFNANAQGCSDAGFCTIGNMNQHTAATKKQKLSLLLSNGVGDESVYVFTPAIQYDNKINAHWAIQGKLTANYANGNLGNATGTGDLFASAIYTLTKKSDWEYSFLLGTKIPLNNGNIRKDSKPLPMQYQSSLGTVDLLAGFSINNKKWFFATALQQPLSGRNRNTFLPAYWNTTAADKYSPTNDFNRKGDILLKAVYNIPSKNKLSLTVGLLGIYHLGEDSYIDGNISNAPIALTGSEGLTLNATGIFAYKVNSIFSLRLSGGVPFVVRKIRPDGLTREFVLTPEIIFNF
jgi:hypothetical protein